jgi:hypothetical protein
VAAACSDLTPPEAVTLAESDLLFLAVQPTAPAVAGETVWVHNGRETTRRLQHADAFGTLFAEVRFPRGALSTLDGQPLGSGDSVLVTLQPLAGRFGITVSPDGLAFSAASRPWITFSYARWGDLSVADGIYGSRSDYADALRLWAEVTPGLWERVGSTGGAGADQVEGGLSGGGVFGAAAPL